MFRTCPPCSMSVSKLLIADCGLKTNVVGFGFQSTISNHQSTISVCAIFAA
jgi:hypothetical protein